MLYPPKCGNIDISQGRTANPQPIHGEPKAIVSIHRNVYRLIYPGDAQRTYNEATANSEPTSIALTKMRGRPTPFKSSIFQRYIHKSFYLSPNILSTYIGIWARSPVSILPCIATGHAPRDDAQVSIVRSVSGHHKGGKKMLHRFA